MREDECEVEFRFKKEDIFRLAAALRRPETWKCQNGLVVDTFEGLCIALKRYTIHDKGVALPNCWGFLDGTVRPICKPTQDQRAVYNGHKRVQAIKFQSVVTPNGLVANLFGPVEGRRHDSGMLATLGLLHQLEQHSFTPDGQPLFIYGDPAYPLKVFLKCPFAGRPDLTAQDLEFNESLSRVCVSVERVFGDIINYFKFADFKKNLKIGLSAVGKMYVIFTVLRNALICLYGSNTSAFFNLQPPILEKYVR